MNHNNISIIERLLQSAKISNISSETKSNSETNSCQDVTSYPLDDSFRTDPEGAFAVLAPSDRKVFDELLHYYFRYDVIYPTHETIARRYGIHEDTVQKSTTKLANLGLISKRFRLGASCVYRISYFFTNNPDMLFRLRHMFKSISGYILRAALTYSAKSLSVVTTGRLRILRYIYKYTNLQIVRGVSMNRGIPLAVQRIDAPLNLFQQCQLSACTDQAIDHANKEYSQRRATIDNPFAYILKVALEFDLDRNLTPNTKLAGDLAFALGVSPANPGPTKGKTEHKNNEPVMKPLNKEPYEQEREDQISIPSGFENVQRKNVREKPISPQKNVDKKVRGSTIDKSLVYQKGQEKSHVTELTGKPLDDKGAWFAKWAGIKIDQ